MDRKDAYDAGDGSSLTIGRIGCCGTRRVHEQVTCGEQQVHPGKLSRPDVSSGLHGHFDRVRRSAS
jgi:hypothetical protein